MGNKRLLDQRVDSFLSEHKVRDRVRARWRLMRMLAGAYRDGWRDRLGPTIGEFIRRMEQ